MSERKRLAVLGHPVSHSRSPAMQNAALEALGLGGEWSYEDIDHFIASPKAFVPGTTMSFAGIGRGSERADIQYLRVYVGQLRGKLGAARLVSAPGVGYRLEADA